MADSVPEELPTDASAELDQLRESLGELRQLRQGVERLTADRGAMHRNAEDITAGLREVRSELAEVNRRAERAEARVDEVDTTARERTEEAGRELRAQIRTRVFVAAAALLVVAAVIGGVWFQQNRERARFDRVHAGLIEACLGRQASDAALRMKNRALRDDTQALIDASVRAGVEDRPSLAPIVTYLRAEVEAFDAYLHAIPAPVDCRARYGDR